MIKFFKKQSNVPELTPTTRDLARIVKEHNVVPVPVYSDKIARDLIVQPRGIIFLRPTRNKGRGRKPIEF